MLKAVGVFAALFALDFVWAKYTAAITDKRAWWASGCASAIILLSGAAAIGYTSEPLMLLPAMAGAFGGTFCAIRWSHATPNCFHRLRCLFRGHDWKHNFTSLSHPTTRYKKCQRCPASEREWF